MKTKFNPEVGEIPTTQVATTTGAQEQLPANYDPHYYDSDARDTIMPRLLLVGKTSKLAGEFRPGKFVFDKSLELSGCPIVPLAIRKYYIETLKFDSQEQPKIFATAQAAHEAGYVIDVDTNRPRVEEIADVIALIQGPKEDPTGFFMDEFGGERYTLALFTLRRGSYRNVYRRLHTDLMRRFKGSIHLGRYDISSAEVTGDKGVWFEWRIKPTGVNTAPFAEWVEQNFGEYLMKLPVPTSPITEEA